MKYLHTKRPLTCILCSLALFGSPSFFSVVKFTQKKIHISGEVEVYKKNVLVFIYFHRMQHNCLQTGVGEKCKILWWCVVLYFFLNILDKGLQMLYQQKILLLQQRKCGCFQFLILSVQLCDQITMNKLSFISRTKVSVISTRVNME